MDNDKPVPYRTQSGLEIGKSYQPPKSYGLGEDILDLNDSYKIQSALISEGASNKRYISFDVGFAIGVVLWFSLIVFLA